MKYDQSKAVRRGVSSPSENQKPRQFCAEARSAAASANTAAVSNCATAAPEKKETTARHRNSRPPAVGLALSCCAALLLAIAGTACNESARAEIRTPPKASSRTGSNTAVRQNQHIIEDGRRLADDTFPVLTNPLEISQSTSGEYFVTDPMDKNIKVYDSIGHRISTVGHAGIGVGEFTNLTSAEVFGGDSVVAIDLVRQRASVFGPNRLVARTLDLPSPTVSTIRVINDSLWLYIAAFAIDGPLLRLVRPSGQIVASFYNGPSKDKVNPVVEQHIRILADGIGDRIIVGLSGGDSLYLFDLKGRQIASGPVDPTQPIKPLAELLKQNGGHARFRDGLWYFDSARFLFHVVALRDSTFRAFVTAYDTRTGADLPAGGDLISYKADGSLLRATHRSSIDRGLAGRDYTASTALFIGYSDPAHQQYSVSTAAPDYTLSSAKSLSVTPRLSKVAP